MIDPREFNATSPHAESEIGKLPLHIKSRLTPISEKKIKQNAKLPQEKFDFPVTRSQEIGWMHNQAWSNGRDRISSAWYRGKGTTDVTQFADAYCTMSGCSPFADKSTR